MTDNNHSEETSKDAASLFKDAHKIDPVAAEGAFFGSTRSEEWKRGQLKNIISGEFTKYSKADDATNKLHKILMRLRMLGDLLEITSGAESPPDEETVWVAGDTILDWVGDAEEARSLLEDRWRELESGRRQQASVVSLEPKGGAS